MLYALDHYQLENSNNPAMWVSSSCGYAIALIICISFRRTLFPYEHKPPALTWAGIVSLPVPFAMFVVAAFLFLNARFDTSESVMVDYTVLGRSTKDHSLLARTHCSLAAI